MEKHIKQKTIRCKGCMRTLCKVDRISEIVKSYKCPWCGTVNHYNGKGHVASTSSVKNIATASGKRFL